MKIFLRMKAWQLFSLLFGIQILIMVIGMISSDPRWMFTIMPLAMLIVIAIFMAWFWTLGNNTNRKVPEDIRPSSRFFRFCIIYSSIYILFFLIYFMLSKSGSYDNAYFKIILPFHIFAMVCMFNCLYFIAKNLVMAERKEKVGFYEFAGPFFLIWFYPIGVWFIQPRVNKMFGSETDIQNESEANA